MGHRTDGTGAVPPGRHRGTSATARSMERTRRNVAVLVLHSTSALREALLAGDSRSQQGVEALPAGATVRPSPPGGVVRPTG